VGEAKILVVEDEPFIRQILKVQLQSAGYSVATAENGIKGLEEVKKCRPDLVLLDLMMPDMDGNEVCKRLKGCYETSNIPVIILTAKSDLGEKVRTLESGANDYLTKPYELDELLARVRNLLRWSQTQREANPLTGFPGNVSIEHEANRRIFRKDIFAFMYIDLDNFKPFNDTYGYRKGDDVIKMIADIIADAVHDLGNTGDFIGHIGGDDFVVMTTPDKSEAIADEIVRQFDMKSKDLYTPADRERGYIEVTSRKGTNELFNLVGVTVAVVTNVRQDITHFARLNDLVSELKRFGKSVKGSIVVTERRSELSNTSPAKVGTSGEADVEA
jgi:diguanylate cyclase (GGDEF)-like protein